MPAGVAEGTERPRRIAHDEDRPAGEIGADIAAGRGELVGVADHLPSGGEERPALVREGVGIGVPVEGKRWAHLDLPRMGSVRPSRRPLRGLLRMR